MKSKILAIVGLLWLAIVPARADYFINQGSQTPIKAGVVGSAILPYSSLVDSTATPFGTSSNPFNVVFPTSQHVICDSGCSGGSGGGGAVFGPTAVGSAAANPPILVGGTIDGTATGAISVLKVLGGSAFINCANCSGSGISVGFGGAIGGVGTPGGFKDGSGNFQPFLGDVTNGQWVSIKGTLPAFASTPTVTVGNATLAVTGTFFQSTQPISAASLPLPTGAATQTTSAAILTALGTPMQNSGGTVTVTQATGSNLHVTCDSGCSSSSSPSFGGAFPATGTPIGMTQGGNLTALSGTGGSLNVNVTNTVPVTLTSTTITGTVTISGTVTANAGTNLNTSALALETGGNLAQLVTDFGAPGATACTTDTASCNLNQQMQRNNQRLTTINTTLGTPFQAGGSIGNTSFAATQATAASLNATVVGTGTFAVQAAQSGTWNVTNISGTVSLPTGAATAANQTSVIGTVAGGTAAANSLLTGGQFNSTPITVTNAQQAALQVDANGYLKVNVVVGGGGTGGTASTFGATFPTLGTAAGMSQAGNMVAMTGTSGNLNVQCANCSGSGASALDAATFTAGSSVFAPTGGEFTSGGATACVTGHQCIAAITADRATFANIADIAGTAVLTGTGAVGSGAQRVAVGTDTATIAGSAPGTAGTASANVLTVQGIASMTPVQVSQATAASLNATVVGTGTFAVQAAQSGTWNITNISGTISLPTGASTSANQPTNAAIASTTSGQTGNLHLGAVTTAAPTYTNAQSDPLSLTTAGALRVDGSGVTQPVSLTSTTITGSVAVTNAGTFAVQLSGATNNINNIAGTVSLPTGASTAALQPTNAAQGSTTSGQTGPLMQAAVLTAAPTYTTTQTSPLNMTTGGALRVADASVVTALGSPFQAGANIGNTSFAATQATASSLNATVVGTGTFAVQATLQASATTAIGKVDPNTIGNWGLQVSTQNSATPTNGALALAQFNTTPTTITTGNVSPLQVDNAGNLLVNIKAGASSGAVAQGSTTSGQTVGLTQAAALTSAPSYTTGTTNPLNTDLSGNLRVTVAAAVGLAQGSTTSGQTGSLIMGAVTTSAPSYTTAQTSPISLDTAGNVRINCVTGCGGSGSISNASSAVATSSTNIGSVSYNYGFNGTTWDQLQVDGSKNLKTVFSNTTLAVTNAGTFAVQVSSALPAGTNLIGKTGFDQTTPGTTNGVQDAATSATGSAPASKAIYTGANGSGNLTGEIVCDSFITYDASTNGSTQLVALSSGKSIYVCGYTITTGATATNVKLIYGTGTACVTSPQPVTPAYQLGVNSGIVDHASNHWSGMKTAASNELCINTSAGNPVQATVYFTQF